jgi:hypothetical protein
LFEKPAQIPLHSREEDRLCPLQFGQGKMCVGRDNGSQGTQREGETRPESGRKTDNKHQAENSGEDQCHRGTFDWAETTRPNGECEGRNHLSVEAGRAIHNVVVYAP